MFSFRDKREETFLKAFRSYRSIFEAGKQYAILDTDVCKAVAERDEIDLLRRLPHFESSDGKVLLPSLVQTELILFGSNTPSCQFVKSLPPWIERVDALPILFDILSITGPALGLRRPAAIQALSILREVQNAGAEPLLLSTDPALSMFRRAIGFRHFSLSNILEQSEKEKSMNIKGSDFSGGARSSREVQNGHVNEPKQAPLNNRNQREEGDIEHEQSHERGR